MNFRLEIQERCTGLNLFPVITIHVILSGNSLRSMLIVFEESLT